jgi:SM-20-related protein
MAQLPFVFTLYRRGSAGLSNLRMSLELGVVLAELTDRQLVLDGDVTPIANIVRYGDPQISGATPSRLTDLFDLGRPWERLENLEFPLGEVQMISEHSAWHLMVAGSGELDANSADARAFRANRREVVHLTDSLNCAPALGYSGGPDANTLSYYSYFFYLDQQTRSRARTALSRLQPKPALSALANEIAAGLGPFNAVHIRRGDFKQTFGTTTLNRAPQEAIEALDRHFRRDEMLLILTDEADDPFFTTHLFIDHHLLAAHRDKVLSLPTHDPIALALLSQLIAAHSKAFVGSMKSTYTALIQRERGLRGLEEPFRFLWNEIPLPDDPSTRGKQKINTHVPLVDGVMVEEYSGPYSWNRVHPSLEPAWMREWPESFQSTAALPTPVPSRTASPESFYIVFDKEAVRLWCPDKVLLKRIKASFAAMALDTLETQVQFAAFEIEPSDGQWIWRKDGAVHNPIEGGDTLEREVYRRIVVAFKHRRPDLLWLHAAAAATPEGAVVIPGAWGRGKSSTVMALHRRGWSYLSDDIAPLDVARRLLLPFPATPQSRGKLGTTVAREMLRGVRKSVVKLEPDLIANQPYPLRAVVFPHFIADVDPEMSAITPGQALALLLENGIGPVNLAEQSDMLRDLAEVILMTPAVSLHYDDIESGVDHLINANSTLADLDHGKKEDYTIPNSLTEAPPATPLEDTAGMARDVKVELALTNGLRQMIVLPETSEFLPQVLDALAYPDNAPALLELPVDGGRSAFSFRPHDLVSVITSPPVITGAALGAPVGHVQTQSQTIHVEIDGFLTPDENSVVMAKAIEASKTYQASGTLGGDRNARRSRVIKRVGKDLEDLFVTRVSIHLPHILHTLGIAPFEWGPWDVQLTASNDGDFFVMHPDALHDGPTSKRRLTFILYVCREPTPFEGGNLLILEDNPTATQHARGGGMRRVTPRNNLLVAFDSSRWHEVERVFCDSAVFEDSRFTLNGWLSQTAADGEGGG